MTQTPTPIQDARDEKKFAAEYEEEFEKIPLEDITGTKLTHSANLDFTYRTNAGSHRTIRCYHGSPKKSYNDIPEGFYSFHHGDRKYAYSPEEQRLITINRDAPNVTVATTDDILRVEAVTFGERAPVVGAVQKDVEATVYYRSPRSDRMQSVTLTVEFLEGRESASEFSGSDDRGRRFEVRTRWERDIVVRNGANEQTLGRVARVEFPRGKRLTVDVEGVPGDRIEEHLEKIERVIEGKAFRHDHDVEVSAEIDGELEWD